MNAPINSSTLTLLRVTPSSTAVSRRGRLARPARRRFWPAAVVSAGLHAALLWAFTPAPRPAPAAPAPELIEVRLALPSLPLEPEEQPVVELTEAAEASGPLPVPTLAEIPTTVALGAFTQVADFRPQIQVNFNAAELVNIPLHFGPGSGNGGAGLSHVFSLADLDRIPEPLVQTPPLYPHDQRRLGVARAEVIVTFVVDPEGRVTNLRVESSSNPEFESSALAGVAKWKFRPGIKSGQKVATRMRVPLRFQLEDADV